VSTSAPLIYLTDQLSNRRFLVDTGAARSVLPHQSSAPSSGPRLSAANGRPIPAWGSRLVPLRFGGTSYTWSFLLAGVDRPILGLDFLAANKLSVDAATGRVFQSGSALPITPGSSSSSSSLNSLLFSDPDIHQLLSEFPEVVSDTLSRVPPLHGVQHTIETTGRPLFAKARRLDPAKLAVAEREFAKMEADGIVRRSKSPWASPLHMVPKPDGSWRPCGDYRRLNNATLHDRYPLPNIQDFAANLSGCTIFSKLDLVKGYYQVTMDAADVPKTAIVTPFGLFEFLRMPFGLKNAAQTFQRLMDRILMACLTALFIWMISWSPVPPGKITCSISAR